jgi:hypothetical protein
VSFSFYIWYRVERDELETASVIRGMMARLACRTGITGRLLKKHDEPRLWMEVYEGVSDRERFQARLIQTVDELDVAMFIDGTRHAECFLDEGAVAPSCTVSN